MFYKVRTDKNFVILLSTITHVSVTGAPTNPIRTTFRNIQNNMKIIPVDVEHSKFKCLDFTKYEFFC